MTELTTQVSALLKEVAEQAILPQYRALHSDQIQEKEPGDYVTSADLASEAMLKKGLTSLLPGSQVVGEEEISANPGLLDDLDDESPIWVIDPLDGTINFVNGVRGFAVQLALVENNVTTKITATETTTHVIHAVVLKCFYRRFCFINRGIIEIRVITIHYLGTSIR